MTMRDVRRAVALSGWVLIVTVCGAFIFEWWRQLHGQGWASPEVTENGKFAMGFLFGAGAALVKEVMLAPE